MPPTKPSSPAMQPPTEHGPSLPLERHADDWEEWEDDEVVTPTDVTEQAVAAQRQQSAAAPSPTGSRAAAAAAAPAKVKRTRSRRRQKAQNAKAGISLVTDMSLFRPRHRAASQTPTADEAPVKFVDAAALRALEGEPNSASVGNWNWLKREKAHSPAASSPQQSPRTEQQLSPEDRPIVIGISLPSSELETREFSPHTPTANQPPRLAHMSHGDDAAHALPPCVASAAAYAQVQRSVWSPDTPDTAHSFGSGRAASSVYSQANLLGLAIQQKPPPVPAVPGNYRRSRQQRMMSLELADASPCTLFEEDGSSAPQQQARADEVSPESASSRAHGWWDHVVTPFIDRASSLSGRRLKAASAAGQDDARPGCEMSEKRHGQGEDRPLHVAQTLLQAPIVRVPTPRKTPSPPPNVPATAAADGSSRRAAPPPSPPPVREKDCFAVADNGPRDQPPPYSPRSKQEHAAAVRRYRAVFPPGHPLQMQFPPSPGPASPGLADAMTCQGATQMADIPLTPGPLRGPMLMGAEEEEEEQQQQKQQQQQQQRRPWAVAACLPQEHEHSIRGRFTSIERQRRRHEKEEAVARRLGGFWRGRGCIPETGCWGRSGREGRQRRRVWAAVCAAMAAALVLVVVLAVLLSRKHGNAAAHSTWVNLTDFPPMPTGVLTVVGPDNAVSKSVCTEPSTLWSCALPKDEQDSVAPYKANQPTVVMRIEWYNGTSNGWRAGPDEERARRGLSGAAAASGTLRGRGAVDGFTPRPDAPSLKEMWFLGNTTDGVKAENKAGEPTPFFISLLRSVDETVGAPRLERREPATQIGNQSLVDLLPAPDLEADGTPAPAVLLPHPVQQPLRLYDRGLASEHYGFYTHFRRRIFVRSATILNSTDDGNVPVDENGGCRKSEADFMVTWSEARVLVRMWTRALGAKASALLGGDAGPAELVRPGTMPYPVTLTLDTHGGRPLDKLVWYWPMDKRQRLQLQRPALLANDMGRGGTWVNPRGSGDAAAGGFDGGSGGCRCEWVNWVPRAGGARRVK